jgi:hypothetical protein
MSVKPNFIVAVISSFFGLLSCGNKHFEVALKMIVLGAVALSIVLWALTSISGDLTTIIEYIRALISPAEVVVADTIQHTDKLTGVPTIE